MPQEMATTIEAQQRATIVEHEIVIPAELHYSATLPRLQ